MEETSHTIRGKLCCVALLCASWVRLLFCAQKSLRRHAKQDFLTTPFPKPESKFANIPVKSIRGVFDTPLNEASRLRELLVVHRSGLLLRPPTAGRVGYIVVWVGVIPSFTSADTANEVSQEILALLLKNGVDDTVLEWREAVPAKLAVL